MSRAIEHGLATGVAGGVELVFATGMPFRAPGSWHGAIGSSFGLALAATGLATTSIIRHRVRTAASGEVLHREATVAFVLSAVCTGLAFGFLAVPGVMVLIFSDPVFLMPLLAVPCSALLVNVAAAAQMGRTKEKRRRAGRWPPPQVVAAGPTGLVVRF